MSESALVKLKIDKRLHDAMREVAKRKRQYLSLTYESAIQQFLLMPDNYLGMDYGKNDSDSDSNVQTKKGL